MPPLTDLHPFSCWGWAALFLWYHTCLRHKSWYHRSKLSGSCNFQCFGIRTIPETSASAALRGFSRRQRPDGGAEGSAAGPSRAGRIRAQQRGYRVQRSGAAFVPRLFEAGPLVYAGGLSMRTSFGLTRQTTYGVISNCALNLFCRSRGRARLARPCRVVFNNGGHHCDCQPDGLEETVQINPSTIRLRPTLFDSLTVLISALLMLLSRTRHHFLFR